MSGKRPISRGFDRIFLAFIANASVSDNCIFRNSRPTSAFLFRYLLHKITTVRGIGRTNSAGQACRSLVYRFEARFVYRMRIAVLILPIGLRANDPIPKGMYRRGDRRFEKRRVFPDSRDNEIELMKTRYYSAKFSCASSRYCSRLASLLRSMVA
jgi:hypothetical protein